MDFQCLEPVFKGIGICIGAVERRNLKVEWKVIQGFTLECLIADNRDYKAVKLCGDSVLELQVSSQRVAQIKWRSSGPNFSQYESVLESGICIDMSHKETGWFDKRKGSFFGENQIAGKPEVSGQQESCTDGLVC